LDEWEVAYLLDQYKSQTDTEQIATEAEYAKKLVDAVEGRGKDTRQIVKPRWIFSKGREHK
jgi:hypothetical protein